MRRSPPATAAARVARRARRGGRRRAQRHPRRRLRPRHRHEPVRRLRLRAGGRQVPRRSWPTTTRAPALARAPSGPCACCFSPTTRTSASGRHARRRPHAEAGRTYVARAAAPASSSARRGQAGRALRRVAVPLQPARPVRLLGPALNGVTQRALPRRDRGAPDGGGVTAINVLDLDSYVRGVVAGEMPSSWPLEALKVQAVAARTYALATRKTSGDVRPVPRHALAGLPRRDRGERAQRRRRGGTAGRILTYGGVPAVTYYFSTSGGHTENIEYSFVGSLSKPWLVGVPDPYDAHSPYHRWQVALLAAALDRALGAPGAFKRLKVLERGVSPRVVRARVIGTRGSAPSPARRSARGSACATPGSPSTGSPARARRARSARPASWGRGRRPHASRACSSRRRIRACCGSSARAPAASCVGGCARRAPGATASRCRAPGCTACVTARSPGPPSACASRARPPPRAPARRSRAGAFSTEPESNGGCGSYSMPSWIACATSGPAIFASEDEGHVDPDDTPAAVITLPCSTTRR